MTLQPVRRRCLSSDERGEKLNSELGQATAAAAIRLIIQYLYERGEMLNSELSQATAVSIRLIIQYLYERG